MCKDVNLATQLAWECNVPTVLATLAAEQELIETIKRGDCVSATWACNVRAPMSWQRLCHASLQERQHRRHRFRCQKVPSVPRTVADAPGGTRRRLRVPSGL